MNSTIKNTLELSVSELSDSIKNLIEDNFGYMSQRRDWKGIKTSFRSYLF